VAGKRALAVLAAALVTVGGVEARAQQPAPTRVRFAFPSIGVVPGETIRVGVASLRFTNPPDPDRVRIRLLDGQGHVVADSGSVELPAVQSQFLSVDAGRLGPGEEGTGRVQVRAVVVVSNPNALPIDPCRVGLEVMSTASGRTLVALPSPVADRR